MDRCFRRSSSLGVASPKRRNKNNIPAARQRAQSPAAGKDNNTRADQLLVHDPGTPASNRETAVKRDDRTGRDSDKGASALLTRCTGAACGGGAGGADVTRDGGAPARQQRTRGEEEVGEAGRAGERASPLHAEEGGAALRTEGPAEPEGAPPAYGCWTRTLRVASRAGERSTGGSGHAGPSAGGPAAWGATAATGCTAAAAAGTITPAGGGDKPRSDQERAMAPGIRATSARSKRSYRP